MMITELAGDALLNLARHKLRSFLTALGIIFGIASVVLMVGVIALTAIQFRIQKGREA